MGLFSSGDSEVDAQNLGMSGIFTSIINTAADRLLPGGAKSSDARATQANPPVQGGVTKAPTKLPGTVSQSDSILSRVWSFFKTPFGIVAGIGVVGLLMWKLRRKRR